MRIMQPSKVPLEEVERVLVAHEGWALQDGALLRCLVLRTLSRRCILSIV